MFLSFPLITKITLIFVFLCVIHFIGSQHCWRSGLIFIMLYFRFTQDLWRYQLFRFYPIECWSFSLFAFEIVVLFSLHMRNWSNKFLGIISHRSPTCNRFCVCASFWWHHKTMNGVHLFIVRWISTFRIHRGFFFSFYCTS